MVYMSERLYLKTSDAAYQYLFTYFLLVGCKEKKLTEKKQVLRLVQFAATHNPKIDLFIPEKKYFN